LRRAVHGATGITRLQKSVFNLGVNPMKPLLGTFGSFLTSGDFRFELRNPIFGGPQLIREFLSRFQRVPAVFIGSVSSFLQKTEDRLTGFVELIVLISPIFSRLSELNYFGAHHCASRCRTD
jgi:hypothetical protein